MTWKERFARMKKVLDVDYKQMAKDIGAEDIEKKADSIRAIATIKEEKFPDAWKWSVVAFERASVSSPRGNWPDRTVSQVFTR